ncbi:hypothetical protein [Pseudomonas veronii]|uniref:hypothetical protein n=1 Tax=Pseudomonas veronii TaxID=76761 RepID=UPI0023DFBE8F|nr:hypothetical protein [Pseudomonas veronii]MDF3241955.1 hypothetical protein [Pseudomonas veronii]
MEYMHVTIVLSAMLTLYWLYEVEYKRYRLDKFRDKLFMIRGGLFDAAARGEIPLDHPAYLILRTNINGMIRFSHDLTFFRFLLMRSEMKSEAGKSRSAEYKRRVEASMVTLTDSQRQLITSTNREVHQSVMLYIAFNSIPGKVFSLGVIAVSVLIWIVKTVAGKGSESTNESTASAPSFVNMKMMRRPIEVLDTEANMIGCAA